MIRTFDPVLHEYRVDGERYSSVSEIISPIVDLTMVPEDRLNFARDRGTAVHKACELDDLDQLDESSVDPEHVLPYLKGWRLFKREHRPAFELIEEPLYHDLFKVGGTPDRWMTIGRHRIGGDIKTVAKMGPAIGVQLSGYELLVGREKKWVTHARWGIQLRKNGTYAVTKYPDETAMFLSLVNLHNWSKKHG